MATKTVRKLNTKPQSHLLLTGKERLAVWESARGMWKNKKPDPIRELKKMRKEWDRKLPPLK